MSERRIAKAVAFLKAPQGRAALAAQMAVGFLRENAGLDDAEIEEAFKSAGIKIASPSALGKKRRNERLKVPTKSAPAGARKVKLQAGVTVRQQESVRMSVAKRAKQWLDAPEHAGVPGEAIGVVDLLPMLLAPQEEFEQHWEAMTPDARALAMQVWAAVEDVKSEVASELCVTATANV
eukprot:TRINITY_DN15812_c0_g1_i1.p2 TRINITY_DN15812_c0_g1~~TRINITY_DN15812_c0_g1_i1.p2  ORF type:complete len:179 (-),score=49.56 TRINITY_DN15812_c0_g1_i1:108-644(-)